MSVLLRGGQEAAGKEGEGASCPARPEPVSRPPLPRSVRVTHLQLALSDLSFQPQQHLAFDISNGSISLRFRRQLLYWFL